MPEGGTSRRRDLVHGFLLGVLIGLVGRDLRIPAIFSYWGDLAPLILLSGALGGVAFLTRLRKIVVGSAAGLIMLWAFVAFTPLTDWLSRDLVRRDPLQKADAVFVLASALQTDGELTIPAMSRLVRGLEILGDGWAPRLILSELPEPAPRYREAACEIMMRLGLEHEVITVGPVRNTHDEAVAVRDALRDFGLERILVVTSPTHSRRAAEALETAGVVVISRPAQEIAFDFENLSDPFNGDHHTRAFSSVMHEHL